VGVQGVGLAELALQQASEWARSRVQGRPAGIQASAAMAIEHHPDVRRMLLTMKANVEAMRALAIYTALQLDRARAETDEARRGAALMRGELLIPILKGWCTDLASEMASLAIQVHGGMGFIEETGVAQTLRDARITSIYEGTTGIQANDLLGRKLGRDGGAAMLALLAGAELELKELKSDAPELSAVLGGAREGLGELRSATESLLAALRDAPASAYAVSVPSPAGGRRGLLAFEVAEREPLRGADAAAGAGAVAPGPERGRLGRRGRRRAAVACTSRSSSASHCRPRPRCWC
jgi:3'-phosphoadenosine 5'-phosphosulfate sulfotransferase